MARAAFNAARADPSHHSARILSTSTPALPAAARGLSAVDLDDLHHAEFLVVHHVAMMDETPGEIQKPGAERHASLAGHHHRIAPVPLSELLAIDRDHLEGIGVDMEDVVVFMLVDDGPFLDRAKGNALIDAIGVEVAAADEIRNSW